MTTATTDLSNKGPAEVSAPGFVYLHPATADALRVAARRAGLPGNLITHRYAWRAALELAMANAPAESEEVDDRGYWAHELAAYDRTFDRVWDIIAASDGDATFAEWLATEMPAGTVINDPAWWANRIARQYRVRSGITAAQSRSIDASDLFAPALLPERERDGHLIHPDYQRLMFVDDEIDVTPFFNAAGLELKSVLHEWPEDDENDGADLNWLKPEMPEGESWRLVSIHDNEDGYGVVWWCRYVGQRELAQRSAQSAVARRTSPGLAEGRD